MNSFQKIISEARKNKGLSQKELVEKIKKEDGKIISTQYYNDIEKGRRIPSSLILEQLSKILDINKDFLFSLAEKIPDDIKAKLVKSDEKTVKAAYSAFRKSLK